MRSSKLIRFPNVRNGVIKSIGKNISYLTLFQLVNISIPLVTYTHLISSLGQELYGLIVFSQAVISYLAIFINFGINTLVVKDISINRSNRLELSRIVCNVYLLKGILFLISLGILTVLIKILPQARGQEKLFYLSMWVGLYEFIVPFWYFQGMEKMKYITVINLISRSIFAFLIFRLINSPDDYLLVPVINGIGAVIAGFFGIFIIFSRDKLSFVIDDLTGLYRLFKEALNYFISDLSIKLFAGSNKVIVGSFLGYSELAYYDLVDKIIHVFRVLPLNIVRDSIYPIVVKTKNIQIIHNTSKAMSVYSLLVILFILFFAPYIVIGLGGEDMVAAIPILKFGSIIILTTHASNYYITAGLWSFGYSKLFRDMMIYSSLFYLIIYFIIWFLEVINLYTIIAAPILVDFFNLIYIYAIYKKYHFGP